MLEKIVNGMRFEGSISDNCYDVRTWTCNGVTERSARRVIEWQESSLIEGGYKDIPYEIDPERDADYLAEQKEKTLRANARRAKTMVRRFIISENFNEMLTLTYRENQPDRALCKKHFSIWSKRMKRALGEFRYCAAFEVQERGSMHVHCATNKLPTHAKYKGVKIKAWQLGTAIWRDIVGADNGLCFVGAAPSKWGSSRRKNLSLAKMASYVSKYILKDFAAAPEESNRYSRSNGKPGGEVHTCRLNGTLPEIIACAFEVGEGDVIVSHHASSLGFGWWLCTEKRPPDHYC
jgi:hypothetical protein